MLCTFVLVYIVATEITNDYLGVLKCCFLDFDDIQKKVITNPEYLKYQVQNVYLDIHAKNS